MSRMDGNQPIIEEERPQQCDLCGSIDELRPYGPNGECVCFECGMKDEGAARKMFRNKMQGEGRDDGR